MGILLIRRVLRDYENNKYQHEEWSNCHSRTETKVEPGIFKSTTIISSSLRVKGIITGNKSLLVQTSCFICQFNPKVHETVIKYALLINQKIKLIFQKYASL